MSVHYSSSVWSAEIGDPVAKLVLLKLADNANDSGACWPSIATVCRETGLSERTVQRKMSYLEEHGFLIRNRGKNCCDYRLNSDKLNKCLIGQSHPVTVTPRQADTPSHSQLPPVTVTPLPRQADTLPRHSDSCLTRRTVIEPSLNRHRTVKRAKPVSDNSKSKGSLQELKSYALEINLPESDGESMFDHWESNGWKNGSNPVKDWKAGIRKWKSQGWLPSQKNHITAKPKTTTVDQYGL